MALEVCDGSGGPTKVLRRVVIALSKTEQEWRDGPTPCGGLGVLAVSSGYGLSLTTGGRIESLKVQA